MAVAPRGVLTRRLGHRLRFLRRNALTPLGAFALALLVRLLWVTLVADPILYRHPYQYFSNAQWIAENPDPWNVVLHYDNWRVHYDRWTAAPLYYIFLAAIFKVFGPSLTLVYWIQCVLGALATAALTAIGARLGGRRGRFAGFLYAFYLPSVQMCGSTLTEALHTPLVLIAFEGLLRSRGSAPRHFLYGLVHGFAALTRSVSSAFFSFLALHRVLVLGLRRAALPVVALAIGGSCVILPWTARNYFLLDEPILIETFAFENLWFSNTFVRDRFKEEQRHDIVSRATLAEQRQAAVDWTWRNLRRSPDKIIPKIVDNIEHLLRPDGVHKLLDARMTAARWRRATTIVFEDLPWLLGWMGVVGFWIWGRRTEARLLVLFWLGYSLLMLVVVFQNEVRYRSILAPFVFAATMSAWGRGPRLGRRLLFALSALLVAFLGMGYLLQGRWTAAGPGSAAAVAASREAAIDRGFSAIRGGQLEDAAAHFDGVTRSVEDVRGTMANAWLNAELKRPAAVGPGSSAEFHTAEWEIDPTLLQEAAWEMLPPPARDQIVIGGADVGAIRGFSYPLPWTADEVPRMLRSGLPGLDAPPHRWTRRKSWIRMRPSMTGPVRLTFRMGAPFPYQGEAPQVTVQALGQTSVYRLSKDMAEYTLDGVLDGPVVTIRIAGRTWNHSDQPSDQGVRVEWARVAAR